MKNILFILLLCVLISSQVNAQVSQDEKAKKEQNNTEIAKFKELQNSLEGYYQIQVVNARLKPVISYEMLKLIAENQDVSESKTVNYQNNIRILVLPKNALEKIVEDMKTIYVQN
jgi:hypothetical protein